MLRIQIPSNGPSKIDFSSFRNFLLPVPPDGIASSRNNNLVLLFDDEAQALAYTDQLTKLPGSQKKVGNEIIVAIRKMFSR